MKKKLFRYFMFLIIIGILITGFFTSELAQKLYKYETEEKLINAARLIQYQVTEDIFLSHNIDYNNLAVKYAGILDAEKTSSSSIAHGSETRITFIDFKGNVLGESEADFHSMGNHIHRKEIQEALQGKVGKDIRFSNTLGVDFLYIAVPLTSSEIIIRISVPLVQLKRIDQIIWVYTAIGILAGLLLTTILALRFSSSMIHPINELISVSKEISEGNYSKRVQISTNDEIGHLANTFNEMTSKLERTLSEMTDKNLKVDSIIDSMISGVVAVDNDYNVMLINSIACDMFGIKNGPGVIGINILELIRNNQIISLLNETVENNISQMNEISVGSPVDKIFRIYTNPIKSKDISAVNSGGIATIHDITNIKKLEQIRTEFVSNVTHELKTPLTSIRGFIETLKNGAIEDKNVSTKFLDIIDIESERLYVLINDILQLSEIETQQTDSNIGIHNVKLILEEIFSVLTVAANKKGVAIDFEVDDNLSINVNRDRIKQMLINLIDNAIKYNSENGHVLVNVCKREGKIIFTIKDSGIGIAEEHISRIFERFYRIDKGRSRNMGGTGLGLSIVKHIVNLYSGSINVKSEPGKGSEFIIQLPD